MSATGRLLLWVGAAAAAGFMASIGLADPATQEAVKKDAQAFAKTLVPTVKSDASTQPTADSVPNFTTNPSAQTYYRNPDALRSDAGAQASSNQGYTFIRNSMDQRPTIPQADLDATVSRSMAIQNDPATYVSGFSTGGTAGSCHKLPPGSGSPGTYEQSCNSGVSGTGIVQRSCSTKLGVSIDTQTAFQYYLGERAVFWLHSSVEPEVAAALSSGVCRKTGDASYCGIMHLYGLTPGGCKDSIDPVHTFTCTQELGFARTIREKVLATGAFWYGKTQTKTATTSPDETGCQALATDNLCAKQGGDICTDAAPTTRIIDGVPVTASCWGWTRSYQCIDEVPVDDCGPLKQQGCSFSRRECLTDDTPCQTFEDIYSCPIPGSDTSSQYICDGEIYCINGDCETIDRTPNAEFGQATAALNSVAQAGKELDPNSLKIFEGERDTCSKTIAGLTNCCAPRGIPIIGGGCDADDKRLKDKKDKGLCHYVGSYCSSKVFGICLKKKEADCCYLSKLSRIIQEQGRPQLGLDFGSAKHSTCDGFTVEQFARLDLSRMDFSEVMADFVDAAKLPDDLQTANDMQSRIQAYYAEHR